MADPTPSKSALRGSARVAALKLLAARRLTEAQLWKKLLDRGYAHEDVRDAVDRCKSDGYVDDALFARLYVEGKVKAVGDARLVAELVRRGIDREAAASSVSVADRDEHARLNDALVKVRRTRPGLGYSGVARALERLGFPASAIYRVLREEACLAFGPEGADARRDFLAVEESRSTHA